MKISYIILETLIHFSRHNSSVFFGSYTTYFRQKLPIKVQVFRFPTTRVKIRKIRHDNLQTKSQFSVKVWITPSIMKDNSPVKLYMLLTKGENQIAHFQTFNCCHENGPNSLCHFSNNRSVFLQILGHPSASHT